MWKSFDGKPYTREEWTAHVLSIPREQFAWCKFITLHATSAPTLKQWAESGPAHDARIRNLQSYYEGLGWHQGPHGFISRSYINGFSPLTEPGVHASCFNHVSIGLEQVGEFDIEDYNSGDGAMVAEMAVHAAAVLHWHIGIEPEPYVYGVSGLHFHIECKHDNHDCPGKTARDKPALIARIRQRMAELQAGLPLQAPAVPPSPRLPVAAPARMTNITATNFGGAGDTESSAYVGMVDPTKLQIALPARLPSDRRWVRVFHLGTGRSALCFVNDVGPYNIHDAYWETAGARPLCETQYAQRVPAQDNRVPSIPAGIDMTPAVFASLGLPASTGEAKVDFQFEAAPAADVSSPAATAPAAAQPAVAPSPRPTIPTVDRDRNATET